MKKISNYFFLLLILLQIFFLSCKTVTKIQKLYVSVSGTYKHPAKISMSDQFELNATYNLIDTSSAHLTYTFVPGDFLTIYSDTTIRFFYSDSITIDYRSEKPIFHTLNKDNLKYNQFYADLSKVRDSIYNTYQFYSIEKRDSIIKNEHYIEDYLSKSDSLIISQINTLSHKYQFPQSIISKILDSELETYKLMISYFFYTSHFPKRDIETIQAQLSYYLSRVNEQKVSIFSQQNIAFMINDIANRLIQKSLFRIKNKEEIKKYYADMQQIFTRGSISYDYLVTCLDIQAKKNNIKLRGDNLNGLRQDAKKSIFKKYVQLKYTYIPEEFSNSPTDKNLYDTHLNSTNLANIISQFEDKPLLIDFWASWCLPCLKKIPETIFYKSQYPNLNIIFISLDKSQDQWKTYLYEHDLMRYTQYRRNYYNQDSLFNQIQEIPKYGLLHKNGKIELFDELNNALIKQYCENYYHN